MSAIALSGNTAMRPLQSHDVFARSVDQKVDVLRRSDEAVEDDRKAADEDVANAFSIQWSAEVEEVSSSGAREYSRSS